MSPSMVRWLRSGSALACVFVCGCGGDPETVSSAQTRPVASNPAPASGGPRKLFDPPPPIPSEAERDSLRRIDAANDDWPLEAIHDSLKPRLERLARTLWGVEAAPLEELLDPAFDGATPLVPELERAFGNGNFEVRRASVAAAKLGAVADWSVASEPLRAPFAGVQPIVRVEIDRIERDGSGFVTLVRARAWARVGDGAVEQAATWSVRWSAAGEQAPASVRSLEVHEFEQCTARVTNLTDQTARWLGTPAWLEREVQHGLGDSTRRVDRALGNEYLGLHGLAVGDVDGDGLEDVYVGAPAGFPNRLLLQNADGSVRDASVESKLALLDGCRSALIVDIDGDRDQDVLVALGSKLLVAYNDGQCVFAEQQVLGGPETGEAEIYSLSAADPDRDGDLDVYCCRYVRGGMIGGVPAPYHEAQNGAPNLYWRNEGGRRFRNATNEVGLGAGNTSYSLSALWHDVDRDGDVDLYVANDFGSNQLFLNDGGTFHEDARARGASDTAASMGLASADFDLDGLDDLYVSNMHSDAGLRLVAQHERFLGGRHPELLGTYRDHARGNTLLRGLGDGRFEDVSAKMGASIAGWSWGGVFTDLDNDAYEDLLVPNGFVTGSDERDLESFFWRRVVSQSPSDARPDEAYRQGWATLQSAILNSGLSYNGRERNTAFRNLGGERFVDASACVGFDAIADSRAVALCDWDDDGRVDALLRSRTGPRLQFLRNQTPQPGHFASFRLSATQGHPDAIGARVELTAGGKTRSKTVHAGEGLLAQSSRRLQFGLGDAERIDTLVVHWTDGSTSRFANLGVDKRYSITQGQPEPRELAPRTLRTFGQSGAAPLALVNDPVKRFVLVEKLPLGPLALPNFDAAPRTVANFVGSSLVIGLFSVRDAASLAAAQRLVEGRTRLERAGAKLALLSIDAGPDLAAARRWAQERGLTQVAGAADGELRLRLEVLYTEVLSDVTGLELPQTLLLDTAGQWTVGYAGEVELGTLEADLAALAQLDPRTRLTARMLGGRWVLRPGRDWATLAAVFREIGAPELASLFASLAPGPSQSGGAPQAMGK